MEKSTICAALLLLVIPRLGISQAQTSKANYQIYAVGGEVKAPRAISTPIPPAPDSVDKDLKARLSFIVAPDGSVSQVRLFKRSRPDFDDYAVKVVRGWKFEPATKNGKPVAVRLETEIRSNH